jgi:DNA-directed RNA polymerase II subunit RPB2
MDEKDYSLNANEFEKYTWEVIKKYFEQDKGHFIINHILSSFNDFIFKKIDDIIEGFNPIQIYNEYIPDKDLYKYQININIKNPEISKPVIHEKNGITKIMTPNEARQRNLCYSGNLYVDLYINVEYLDKEENDEDNYSVIYKNKIIKKINLGRIPIMVNSNYCILKNPNILLNNSDECKYEHGGYFIINGNEKVIVSQDRIAENKTYVFKDTKLSAYYYIAEIRSVPENIFSPPKLTVLKLSSKSTQFGKYMRVVIHHVKHDIPIFILFRALGIESDKEIIQYILYDLDDAYNLKLAQNLKGCIEESKNYLYTSVALEYLSNYLSITGYPKEMLSNKDSKINIIKKILKEDFLPHVGTDYKNKSLYLGYMVKKLLMCSMELSPLDDRDSYINKRIDTPGIMMANLFRQYYGKVIRDMKNMIYKEIQNGGSWKINNNFLNIINQSNIYKIMKSTTIESGFKYSLATGNWGVKNQLNKSKQGVAQVLNRLTYMATLSHLRRINTPMEKNGKLIHPRKLHNTQWGIICPSETPEGSSIGLVKNLSMITTITISSDSRNIKEHLNKLGVILFNGDRDSLKKFYKNTKIIINGNIIGYHTDPFYLFTKLKQFKRCGIINIYTSIAWYYQENEIIICTESGRCVRPTYIIDNIIDKFISNKSNKINNLRFDKKCILKILNDKIKFYELFDLKKHNDIDYDLYNNDNLNKLKENTIIEYLDAEENNTTLVAINFKNIHKGFKGNTYPKKYQYLEIHPSLILGLCASNIPFPDHNQAPRNTYQASMGKQAIGIYSSNFRNRMDTLGNILNYPQLPLVKTKISDITGCNSLPCGINVIVAIGTFTGFNQEDSIMINKSAVDRGLFNSTFYRTYKDQCNKNHSTGEEEEYCKPDKEETKGMKPFNYDKLDDNGFIKENTYVSNNDIIMGKRMPNKVNDTAEAYKFKDNSIPLKQNEYGFIDRNFSDNKYFLNVNNDGYKFSKVKIRNIRIPTIGDKLSSRHGQKGIIGMIYNQEDLPFTKDGIYPDIIINPHAIPSRMTIAQLLECIMGKVCVLSGNIGDSTAFIHKNKKEKKDHISSLLHNYGYNKYGDEVMYNPRSGEQINTNIFIGPTYYQRLKHMVKDKIHSRSANGPIILLTRQPAEGRAREGGLRLGEMEVECNWGHGTLHFLKERLMECSDNYRLFTCKDCGNISIVNPTNNIFKCISCKNSVNYSQIRIPYTCKLLFQEIQCMSINTKFITK